MCRSGCPTQDHQSWGECARAANMRIAYCGVGGGDATAQKQWDNELSLYRQARAAMRQSDAAGAAYGRDFAKAVPVEDH